MPDLWEYNHTGHAEPLHGAGETEAPKAMGETTGNRLTGSSRPHSETLPISPVTTGCDSRTQEVLMREGIDGIRG